MDAAHVESIYEGKFPGQMTEGRFLSRVANQGRRSRNIPSIVDMLSICVCSFAVSSPMSSQRWWGCRLRVTQSSRQPGVKPYGLVQVYIELDASAYGQLLTPRRCVIAEQVAKQILPRIFGNTGCHRYAILVDMKVKAQSHSARKVVFTSNGIQLTKQLRKEIILICD